MPAIVGVAHGARLINDERRRQPPLVAGGLPLRKTLRRRPRPGPQRVGRDHPQQVALPNAERLVEVRLLIGQAQDAWGQFAAEVRGVLGLPQSDGDDPQARRLNVLVVQL